MGFLRLLGAVNAAVWLGAVVSLTLAILPAVFSQEMRLLLTPAGHARGDDAGFAGAVAMIIFSRFFILQYVCGFIAILHALAGALYVGRPLRSLANYALLIVVLLSLFGGGWLQPKIRNLHTQKYDVRVTAAQKDQAGRSLGIHHGFSEGLNIIALGGLIIYFWRVAYPNDPARKAGIQHKFRS